MAAVTASGWVLMRGAESKPEGPRSIWAPRRVGEVGAQFPDRLRMGFQGPELECTSPEVGVHVRAIARRWSRSWGYRSLIDHLSGTGRGGPHADMSSEPS